MRTSLRYPYPTLGSGSEKAAPLGESGGAGQLVGAAVLVMGCVRNWIGTQPHTLVADLDAQLLEQLFAVSQ